MNHKKNSVSFFITAIVLWTPIFSAPPLAIAGMAILLTSTKVDVQTAESMVKRGILKAKNGDYEGAFIDYKKAIEIDPKNR